MFHLLPIAYIDPGSGVQIFSSIGPFLAAFFAALAGFLMWPLRHLKGFFSSTKRVVIFSSILAVFLTVGGFLLYNYLQQ